MKKDITTISGIGTLLAVTIIGPLCLGFIVVGRNYGYRADRTMNNQRGDHVSGPQEDQRTVAENSMFPAGPALLDHGRRDKKELALTFDADMTPKMLKDLENGVAGSEYDSRIIKYLKKEKISATIFMTGMWAEKYPEAAKEIASSMLFEIGDHSYDHAAFKIPCWKLAEAKDKKNEIIKAQAVLEKITGYSPKTFRFPGGCFMPEDLKLVADSGLKAIGWDVVSGDAFSRNATSIKDGVLNKTQNGSIIVMHLDGGRNAPETYDALRMLIPLLKGKGYEFVVISRLLEL